MVGDENQSIFFVGYADPSTPAGKLRAAAQGETFMFSQSGGELTRRCDVQEFDLTAHANRDELLDFVGRVSPRTVILGHGDVDSQAWFEEQIRATYPKIKVLRPAPGEECRA
jgi:Cft2 family RNA processing exonuclease